MKIIRAQILIALAITIFTLSGHAQNKAFVDSCYWDIPLAPEKIQRLKGDEIDIAVSKWEWKREGVDVLCFETKLKSIKTSAEAENYIASFYIDLVKKKYPVAKVVSTTPLTIDGHRGHTYTMDFGTDGGGGEVRVVTKGTRGYAMFCFAPGPPQLRQLQKVLDGFRIKY